MSEYQPISLQLPRVLVEEMDEKAKKEFKNRTEYIKDLIIVDLKQSTII